MNEAETRAGPSTFDPVLKATGWGVFEGSRIRDVGEELYKRLGMFVELLTKVGKSLNSSVDNYNAAVGSFERQLIPGARKFAEMGVETGKPIEAPEPLEKQPRMMMTTAGKSSVKDA